MNPVDEGAKHYEEPTVPSWLRETAKAEPVEPPWIPRIGDIIDGQFEILEKGGEGGVGIVYRAMQKDLGRLVAIKIMNVAGKEDLFEREAKATARVKHPNAITIHQIGQAHGTPYLVLEWLDGSALSAKLKRESFSLEEALRIMICVVDVLACAHAHGIIHRDLSPNNVFLTNDNVVKVLDFGLAAFASAHRLRLPLPLFEAWLNAPNDELSSRLTTMEPIVTPSIFHNESVNSVDIDASILVTGGDPRCGGTPGFIAPEQLRNSLATTGSDIWSAGILLFLLVAYRMPYSANSMREYVEQVQYQQATRLREYVPQAPASLESLVARMLEHSADARPTANQVRDELHTILEELDMLEIENRRRAIFASLTPRQREIATLLVETGLSQKEIAAKLDCRDATIRAHVERIFRQLRVHSRSELVQFFNVRMKKK